MSTARYDGIADWYDRFARSEVSGWMRNAEELIADLLGPGPGRCLDLGCGTGVFVEVARLLRPGGRFVHAGTHPCFVSTVASSSGDGSVKLYRGYHESRLVFDSPTFLRRAEGLRARVGAWQVPLAGLPKAVAGAGLRIERVLESPEDPPGMLALAAVRDR